MTDGIYQSVMCYFMPYLMYRPANFETISGLKISDRTRIGCEDWDSDFDFDDTEEACI